MLHNAARCADDNAAQHWKENVAGAADRFLALYRALLSPPAASLD